MSAAMDMAQRSHEVELWARGTELRSRDPAAIDAGLPDQLLRLARTWAWCGWRAGVRGRDCRRRERLEHRVAQSALGPVVIDDDRVAPEAPAPAPARLPPPPPIVPSPPADSAIVDRCHARPVFHFDR